MQTFFHNTSAFLPIYWTHSLEIYYGDHNFVLSFVHSRQFTTLYSVHVFLFYITVCFCSSCKSNTLSMFSVDLRLQSVNVVSLSFLLDQLTLILSFLQCLWIFDDGLRDLRVTWISTVFFFLTLYLLPSPNFVICYIALKGNLIDNFMFIFWIFYISIYFITLIPHKVVTKL